MIASKIAIPVVYLTYSGMIVFDIYGIVYSLNNAKVAKKIQMPIRFNAIDNALIP